MTLVAVLEIESGRLDEVVDYYRRNEVIELALPYGLQTGVLARSDAPPGLRVVSTWPDSRRYRSWLDASIRESLIEGLSGLIGGTTSRTYPEVDPAAFLTGYTVVHRVTASAQDDSDRGRPQEENTRPSP